MRFTSAIVAAIALASIGAQAAPTPDGASSTSVAPHKPTEKVEHKPDYKPEHKPEEKKEDKKEDKKEEYEIITKKVAFFHGWDIYNNDLHPVTDGKYIYDCVDELLKNKEADAISNYEGKCYPKSLEHVKPWDFFKTKKTDLAIEGCCEDLIKEYSEKKCFPEGFLDCCYDKEFHVKVPKKKDDKKYDDKKHDDKKYDDKKDEKKYDDKKEDKKYDDKKEDKKYDDKKEEKKY